MPEGLVAQTLLRNWGKRLAKGQAPIIPIYVGGSWTITVARGNKRALRVVVPGKKKQQEPS